MCFSAILKTGTEYSVESQISYRNQVDTSLSRLEANNFASFEITHKSDRTRGEEYFLSATSIWAPGILLDLELFDAL